MWEMRIVSRATTRCNFGDDDDLQASDINQKLTMLRPSACHTPRCAVSHVCGKKSHEIGWNFRVIPRTVAHKPNDVRGIQMINDVIYLYLWMKSGSFLFENYTTILREIAHCI